MFVAKVADIVCGKGCRYCLRVDDDASTTMRELQARLILPTLVRTAREADAVGVRAAVGAARRRGAAREIIHGVVTRSVTYAAVHVEALCVAVVAVARPVGAVAPALLHAEALAA